MPAIKSELAVRIGARIRALRLAAKLNQEVLADGAGISVSMLSMVERGHRCPHVETLACLALVLGVATGSLIPDELEVQPTEPGPDQVLAALQAAAESINTAREGFIRASREGR
ncbi:MAG TPA: helix-turn-helix transcriptional regulator [Anaeromyxobacteraceae bacterium]|nr:helix-turn-helix transcriptional regulator [Anaeromyxobacteraceae bacterium]